MSWLGKIILFLGVAIFFLSVMIPAICFSRCSTYIEPWIDYVQIDLVPPMEIAFFALLIGIFLCIVGCVFWIRAKNTSPFLPPLTFRQLFLIQCFLVIFVFMNFQVHAYPYETGSVERFYGWPVPVACKLTVYSPTMDNHVYSGASFSDDFSFTHFQSHPHLYIADPDARLEYYWPLGIPNILFALIFVMLMMQGFHRWFPAKNAIRKGVVEKFDGNQI